MESIARFSPEELIAAGEDPALVADPNYVPARPVLSDIADFDAAFFGYSPREAVSSDPQQRLFLECAWEALEQAGQVDPRTRGRVGVFGGVNFNNYFFQRADRLQDEMGLSVYELIIGNEKDALTLNVSYRLNLTGPSVAVQTFCSSSLVAVHLAAQGLRRREFELALAGGVSIRLPDRTGHLYQEGGMESPDGHVRTFDADARGSMFGDGAAVVLLKRLDDAIADRDTVLAVIRGSAVNNDGSAKFGFAAPSLVGQGQAVASAMADAGITARDVSYVEAHGTATELGDPIEVAALNWAFGPVSDKQYCVLGSVKTNVGHLDRAAGTTGLIKVVLSLQNELIPPTLHFQKPNPEIDFADSPFYVTADPTPWPRDAARPRVAGLNSLGMGGTNVHVVLTEAPEPEPRPAPSRRFHVLPVSARSAAAADESCQRLGRRLAVPPDLDLGDVAFTLQVGRKLFDHRRVVVTDSAAAAAAALCPPCEGAPPPSRSPERKHSGDGPTTAAVLNRTETAIGRHVAFLVAGVGEHFPGMVAALYEREPLFRAHLDECCRLLGPEFPADLAALLGNAAPETAAPGTATAGPDLAGLLGRSANGSTPPLNRTEIAQPAVFVAGYALARTLMDWGVRPTVMIGYSVGEYVTACLAGVLSLPDAVRLVAYRAALVAGLPGGAMLAVNTSADALATLVPDLAERGLDLAADNGAQVVVAGPSGAVADLARHLRATEVICRQLETTHAFHSRMLQPAADELTRWVTDNVTRNPPALPYVSNVTGDIADAALVTDPAYWARHMCGTVRFAAGLAVALRDPDAAFVEIGPGPSLGAMLRTHPGCTRDRWSLIVPTLPSAIDRRAADHTLTDALGRLWLAGVPVDWHAYHGLPAPGGTEHAGGDSAGGDSAGGDSADAVRWRPGRVHLPTYPFQRQTFWVEATPGSRGGRRGQPEPDDLASALAALPRLPEARFLNLPVWRQTAARRPAVSPEPRHWLLYGDSDPVADDLAAALRATGDRATIVRPGDRFQDDPADLRIRPGDLADIVAMLRTLRQRGGFPDRFVHLWTLSDGGPAGKEGLHSLVALARATGEIGLEGWSLDVVSRGTQRVLPDDVVVPARTTVLGPCRIIPVEYPGVKTRLIDLAEGAGVPVRALLTELLADPADQVVALRGGRRWIPDLDVLEPPEPPEPPAPPAEPAGPDRSAGPNGLIRPGGVYLVTGGLGGIGMAMAERLAEQYRARLVLFGRTPVPPRQQWEAILATPDAAPEVRRRIESLHRLHANGIEVEVVSGDVADAADVRRAVELARQRFGALNGVLHCAGVPAVGLMQFKTNADMDRVLAPKVAGTLALGAALAEVPVDFLALFSSVTSATGGGPGQVDYCAANAFLDGYAFADPLPGCRVVSVGWGEWTWNGWTSGLDGFDPIAREYFEQHRAMFGITFDEGWRCLQRILESGERHVFVSTQDFPTQVAQSRRSSVADYHAVVQKTRSETSLHPRPDLSTPYVAPQSEAERVIAEVWGEALGIDKVGTGDNFFELGGNSLVGVDIVARVRRKLNLDYLPPHIMYEAPTVSALAAATDTANDEDPDRAAEQESRIQRRRTSLRTGRS